VLQLLNKTCLYFAVKHKFPSPNNVIILLLFASILYCVLGRCSITLFLKATISTNAFIADCFC